MADLLFNELPHMPHAQDDVRGTLLSERVKLIEKKRLITNRDERFRDVLRQSAKACPEASGQYANRDRPGLGGRPVERPSHRDQSRGETR